MITLDSVCSSLHIQGIGAKTNSASVISYENEDVFWETGVISFKSPKNLLNMVFFYVGLHFCFRGGQEQQELKFGQFSCVPLIVEVYD